MARELHENSKHVDLLLLDQLSIVLESSIISRSVLVPTCLFVTMAQFKADNTMTTIRLAGFRMREVFLDLVHVICFWIYVFFFFGSVNEAVDPSFLFCLSVSYCVP